MYQVSDEYKKKIIEPSRHFYWSGKIITKDNKEYLFDNGDIVKGSAYITRQCSGSNEIELGTVYAAELGISLFSNINRYTLNDACITVDFHLQLSDGTYETVPMGVFYVAEANRRIKMLEIKAYDAMLNLDKVFNKGLSSAYPYDYLSHLAKACKVELAQTKKEIESLVNGRELFGIYQDNDIQTWRDFLYYLSQALGCFATIDRFGKLLLVPYKSAPSKIISSKHRFTSSFSDFVTKYTAISFTNKKQEKIEYYAKNPDDGLTMNLGVNPLLQFGLEESRKRMLEGILEAVSCAEYVPFDIESIGDPALDLGDVLQFTGGHADETKVAAITSITTKINGKQAIKCVGKNPRLAEAKSKNDKNITGLINSINENKIGVYTFTNALPIDVGNNKTSIINLEFASGKETNAQFQAQCTLLVNSQQNTKTILTQAMIDLGEKKDEQGNSIVNKQMISFPISWKEDAKAKLTVYYKLDGHEVEQFHPKESWLSGNHLLTMYYPLIDLKEDTLHTFEVLISLNDATAHINAQDIMATIIGQGLGVQQRWDGRITAEDSINTITLAAMPTFSLHENANVHFIELAKKGLTDSLENISLSGMNLFTLKDELRLFSPVVCDIVESSDSKKMQYSSQYVLAEKSFTLRTEFEILGRIEQRLNRGRMIKLTIPTEAFETLTSIKILPFETLPFVNKHKLQAHKLKPTKFIETIGESMQLKKKYSDLIYGQDAVIDRGRLAIFSMGFENMETITDLEVTNG